MVLLQFDSNNVLLNTFNSYEEAEVATGVSIRKIKRCITGECKTGGGYVWTLSTKDDIEKPVNRGDYENDLSESEEDLFKQFLKWKRQRLNSKKPSIERNLPKPYKGNPDNVLVISDIHAPFTRKGYLEFTREVQEKYDCGTIVFIGDIIDNHYSSYHETDPDGLSAKDELNLAKKQIQEWYSVFPEAKVCIGNHDAIITRKAFSSGISNKWIKRYDEVLNTPGWEFDIDFEIHGVYYYHGTGSSGDKAALNRAMNLRMPVVQGHIHTSAGVQYNASKKDLVWGLQVGCGIDDEKYAFAYAKSDIKKSIIGCGVVLNKGKLPIFIPMHL